MSYCTELRITTYVRAIAHVLSPIAVLVTYSSGQKGMHAAARLLVPVCFSLEAWLECKLTGLWTSLVGRPPTMTNALEVGLHGDGDSHGCGVWEGNLGLPRQPKWLTRGRGGRLRTFLLRRPPATPHTAVAGWDLAIAAEQARQVEQKRMRNYSSHDRPTLSRELQTTDYLSELLRLASKKGIGDIHCVSKNRTPVTC